MTRKIGLLALLIWIFLSSLTEHAEAQVPSRASEPATAGTISTRSIAGQILGTDSGLPISFATVWAAEVGNKNSEAPVILRTIAGKDGRFSLLAPQGHIYSICVNASGYLDPCRWSNTPTIVDDSSNGLVQVALVRGVPLEVVLRYDEKLLSTLKPAGQSNALAPVPPVQVFYKNPASGRNVLVPFGTVGLQAAFYFDLVPDDPNGRVSLMTSQAGLAGADGKAYLPGTAVPIPVVAASTGPFGLGGPMASQLDTRIVAFTVLGLTP